MIYDGANFRINIEGADSTIILDSWTNTLKANIASSTGEVLLDEGAKTFYGNFRGDIRSEDNSLIVDHLTKDITANNIQGNLIDGFGNMVFDYEGSRFHGNFVGDLYDSNGDVVANVTDRVWYGDVQGKIVGEENSIDIQNGVLNHDVYGNLYAESGRMSFDKETGTFKGVFAGEFFDYNGNNIFDLFQSAAESTNEIVNDLGETVFAANSGTFHQPVSGDFSGSFTGNLHNEVGEMIYSLSSDHLKIKSAEAELFTGVFNGKYSGDIYNPYTNALKYDSTMEHWQDVSLTGYLYAQSGAEVFDPYNNIISSQKIYTKELYTSSIDIDSVQIDAEGLRLNIESAFSTPAIEANFYRDQIPNIPHWFQQGIELCGVGGSWMQPEGTKPGDQMPALTFTTVLETGAPADDSSYFDSTVATTGLINKSCVAYVGAKIPDDDVFDYSRADQDGHGTSGELLFVVNNVEAGPQYTRIDKWGKLHTSLAELKVEGETGVIPSDPIAPDSWLQVTVNGETKFLPLHS